jgi:hypothetical protein
MMFQLEYRVLHIWNIASLVFSDSYYIDIMSILLHTQTDVMHKKQDKSYLIEALSTNPEYLKNKVTIFPSLLHFSLGTFFIIVHGGGLIYLLKRLSFFGL